MASIKLTYFDARGFAETSRLTLALAGQEFEDVRFSREDWPKYKPEAPFGQAPYLEYNGKKYGQSVAIATFLAREFGLHGKTNLEALRVDEVVQLVKDVHQVWLKSAHEQDEAKKAELEKKMLEEELPKFFRIFQKLLEERGTGVFVGHELTLADVFVWDLMFQINKVKGYDAAAKFPALQTLKDKFESNPRIKTYLANRKDTPM